MQAYKKAVYQPSAPEEILHIVDSVNEAAKKTLRGRSGLVSIIGSYAPFFENATGLNFFENPKFPHTLKLPHDIDILFMPNANKTGERDTLIEYYAFHKALGNDLSQKGIITAPFAESNYGPEIT